MYSSIVDSILDTTNKITSGVISSTTYTVKAVVDSVKGVRVEDVTKFFMTDPRTLRKNLSQTSFVNDESIDELDRELCIDDVDLDNIDVNEQDRETQKTEEYLLSIHSTKMRSRRRRHIRGSEEVVILNKRVIDTASSKKHLNYKVVSAINAIENKDKLSIDSISFSGGGYNCMYHMGVLRYIFKNPELFKDTKYLGASGGAGAVSIVLCYEEDPNRFEVLEDIILFVIEMKSKNLKLHKQVEEYSQKLCSYITEDKFNKHIRGSERCHISVTNVTYVVPVNEIKTQFESYTQFMDTLRATACVPILLDDKIRTIDKNSYLDGGLSNNIPILNDNTLRISCLNYPLLVADLYPKYMCDIRHCFIPPDEHYIMNMHDQGYSDIEEYMRERYEKLQSLKTDEALKQCITSFVEDPSFVSE